MNRITIKCLIVAFCLCLSFVTNAQQKKSKTTSIKTNIQLTSDNQKALDETGYVRCYTVEAEAIRRQENPSLHNEQDFENWIAPLVEQKKQEMLNANYRMRPTQVYIPIIFHVITDGAGPENLSQAQIQAQIDQLNLDFNNQAGSVIPAAASADITFVAATIDPGGNPLAEPGINRITTYGGGQQTRAFLDNTIKPATIWDRTLYANVWTADIGGGLLGWAQFPSNSTLPGFNVNEGSALSDGVVVLYSSVGSVANPFDGGVYAAGRTLTHEIGHWIGLRHVWGDGACGTDDYCADTPEMASASSGCPTGRDSCTGYAGLDAIENFMDYSYDNCMDTFTFDQVARILTVLQNSPGRTELPNSPQAGALVPTVSFTTAAPTTINEGSDCNVQDFTFDFSISEGGSASSTVSLVPTGSATVNSDFELINNSVVFASGATASTGSNTITLRVYNDDFIESDESISLAVNVSSSGDTVATSNTHSINVVNDDYATAIDRTVTIISQDFESGLSPYTTQGNTGSDRFLVGNSASLTSAYWSTDGTNSSNFVYTNDDSCNCNKANDRLTSPSFSLDGPYTSATLTFDHAFSNVGAESADVLIDTGSGFTTILSITNTSTAGGGGAYVTPWVNNNTINLTPYIGNANVQLQLRYNDGGGWAYGMALDNVSVTAVTPTNIQSAVNTVTSDEININSSGIVYSKDNATSDVMMDISNNTAFDFDCTSISVSRAGTSAQSYDGSTTPDFVTDKRFTIAPTNTTTTGDVDITFYFTLAEVLGWEGATGDTRNNIVAFRESTSEIVTLTVGAFGTDITFTGNFTGLDGDYYFGPLNLFNNTLQVDENSLSQVTLYPNPSDGIVNIIGLNAELIKAELYNINGQKLNTYTNEIQIMDISELSQGVYFIKLNTTSGAKTFKIIKK